ncbi:uncharacterized protein VTP21DRAFT_4181 [Calcarisporiella thermophila]|uniref:uncharacterized protein n=1 Tax=Calcarisporiella thermophila TaxID=911321 RepID=UPI0037439BE6
MIDEIRFVGKLRAENLALTYQFGCVWKELLCNKAAHPWPFHYLPHTRNHAPSHDSEILHPTCKILQRSEATGFISNLKAEGQLLRLFKHLEILVTLH